MPVRCETGRPSADGVNDFVIAWTLFTRRYGEHDLLGDSEGDVPMKGTSKHKVIVCRKLVERGIKVSLEDEPTSLVYDYQRVDDPTFHYLLAKDYRKFRRAYMVGRSGTVSNEVILQSMT